MIPTSAPDDRIELAGHLLTVREAEDLADALRQAAAKVRRDISVRQHLKLAAEAWAKAEAAPGVFRGFVRDFSKNRPALIQHSGVQWLALVEGASDWKTVSASEIVLSEPIHVRATCGGRLRHLWSGGTFPLCRASIYMMPDESNRPVCQKCAEKAKGGPDAR